MRKKSYYRALFLATQFLAANSLADGGGRMSLLYWNEFSYHYSTLYGYVSFYGQIPTLSKVRYEWKIRVPKIFEYDRGNYYGHGWLFRS